MVNEDDILRRELAARGFTNEEWNEYTDRSRTPGDAERCYEFREAKDALKEALIAQQRVEMGAHGDEDYPVPYLRALDAEFWWVDSSEADAVDPAVLCRVDPAWKEALDRYLVSHGLEAPEGPNQPGWWVSAKDMV